MSILTRLVGAIDNTAGATSQTKETTVREILRRTSGNITKGCAILALLAGGTAVHGQSGTRNALGSGVPSAEVPAPRYESSSLPKMVPQPMEDYGPSDYVPTDSNYDSPTAEAWYGPEDNCAENQWVDSGCLDFEPPVYSSGSWVWSGSWYTQQDFVVYNKLRPNRQRIAGGTLQAVNPANGDFTFNAELNNDTDNQGFGAGTRLTVGRLLGRDPANRDQAVEFTFLGLFEWDSHGVVGNVAIPNEISTTLSFGPTNGFIGNDEQTADFGSDLNSFEMNYRIRTRPGRDQLALQPNGIWVRHGNSSTVRSLLGGIRVVSANDSFLVQAFDVTNGVRTEEGRYLVQTNNDLFGMQVGFDVQHAMNAIQWGLRTKVGGLYNFAGRRSFVTPTPDPFVTPSEKVSDDHLSFLAEAALTGMYKFRPNLGVRFGYEMLFVSNLGIAAENLGLNGAFPNFNHNGSGFYHGGSAGFEAFW